MIYYILYNIDKALFDTGMHIYIYIYIYIYINILSRGVMADRI